MSKLSNVKIFNNKVTGSSGDTGLYLNQIHRMFVKGNITTGFDFDFLTTGCYGTFTDNNYANGTPIDGTGGVDLGLDPPSEGIFNRGDFIQNVDMDEDGETNPFIGWVIVYYRGSVLAANAVVADPEVLVSTVTGSEVDDVIGIERNDGTTHWTTISSKSGASGEQTLGLTDALDDDNADSGNLVHMYRYRTYGTIS
jgi:hypothetical protein